jgi:hypothetical protein
MTRDRGIGVLRALVAVIAAGWAGATLADSDRLASVLGCFRAPEPTGVLLSLRDWGLLGKPMVLATGNAQCWPLTPALKYRGAQFETVCAAVDKPEEARRHPGLYSGMALAPYAGLWLEATVDVSTLYRWAKRVLPHGGHVGFHASDRGAVISCTGSWFPPVGAGARA